MDKLDKIYKLMNEKVQFERKCFFQNTRLRIHTDLWLEKYDELNDLVFVDDNSKITDIWCEYLLDTFDPDWERENLSFDKWYLRWYYDMLNDFIKYVNTTK